MWWLFGRNSCLWHKAPASSSCIRRLASSNCCWMWELHRSSADLLTTWPHQCIVLIPVKPFVLKIKRLPNYGPGPIAAMQRKFRRQQLQSISKTVWLQAVRGILYLKSSSSGVVLPFDPAECIKWLQVSGVYWDVLNIKNEICSSKHKDCLLAHLAFVLFPCDFLAYQIVYFVITLNK